MLKLCPKCNEMKKPRSPNRRICVQCSSKDRMRWYHENKESQKEIKAVQGRRYREKDPERYKKICREWVRGNWSSHLNSIRRYRAKHRETHRAYDSMYQASKRVRMQAATPKWANKFFMQEIYRLARLRSAITGVKWHVDHVIPLHGENVCGLHVENNMQVIPAKMNLIKSNKMEAQN